MFVVCVPVEDVDVLLVLVAGGGARLVKLLPGLELGVHPGRHLRPVVPALHVVGRDLGGLVRQSDST